MDRLQNTVGLKGLDDEVFRPCLNRVEDNLFLSHSRAHHHLRVGVLGTNRFERLQTVHFGHGDVHEHQVGLELFVEFDGFASVRCLADNLEAVLSENILGVTRINSASSVIKMRLAIVAPPVQVCDSRRQTGSRTRFAGS